MLKLVTNENAIFIANNMGEFCIRKNWIETSPDRFAGPGYISEWQSPTRLYVSETRYAQPRSPGENLHYGSAGSINAPRFGGIGAFGCHLRLKGNWYTDQLTGRRSAQQHDKTGVVNAIVQATQDNQAIHVKAVVPLTEASVYPRTLMLVYYHWTFHPDSVSCIAGVSTRPHAEPYWIKEPKFKLALIPDYRLVRWYNQSGKLLGEEDTRHLKDPRKHTRQIRAGGRWRVEFSGWTETLNFIGAAWNGSRPVKWRGANYGLDKWAQDANQLNSFEPMTPGQRYCLQGANNTLSRSWELVRGVDDLSGIGLLFLGWAGGSGHPDCWCAGKPLPQEKRYNVYFKFSTK